MYEPFKSLQDTDISSGMVKFQLPPEVRNNNVKIHRISRPPAPKINISNLERGYVKRMKELENYYTLEVDYLPIERRPTLAELGKKGKDLYDLYDKVAKNAKNKGDITRPKRPQESEQIKETFVLPEGMPPPTPEGVWEGYDDIPMGIPAGMPYLPPSDEGKHDTLETDELFNKKDDADVWLKERMKLIEAQEADEAEYSDEWDEQEKKIIEYNFAPKDDGDDDDEFDADAYLGELEENIEGVEDVKLDDELEGILNELEGNQQPIYDMPENPFESMEQMKPPEREFMKDD